MLSKQMTNVMLFKDSDTRQNYTTDEDDEWDGGHEQEYMTADNAVQAIMTDTATGNDFTEEPVRRATPEKECPPIQDMPNAMQLGFGSYEDNIFCTQKRAAESSGKFKSCGNGSSLLNSLGSTICESSRMSSRPTVVKFCHT